MKDFSWLSRTALMVSEEALMQLSQKHVLVVGMGGVGSFAAEFIARSGIGKITIVDGDVVDPSNRNRQLPALVSTTGKKKTDIMQERLLDINPELELHVIASFVEPDSVAGILDSAHFDFVIDAIDSLTPKLTFLKEAYNRNLPIVSAMGAGGKFDPTQLKVVDISKTYHCPFAQQVRKNLKQAGIYNGIKAVFSTELPDKNSIIRTDGSNYKKSAYGTISYLPATFGAVCSSVVIRALLGIEV